MKAETDGKRAMDGSAILPDVQHIENDEGASLTPENEMEVSSTQEIQIGAKIPPGSTDNIIDTCATMRTSSSPCLEIASPRPSLHRSSKNSITAAVEDWDEDDSHNPSDYTPPSSFSVTTPPLIECSASPGAQFKSIETVKPDKCLQEHRDAELHRKQSEPSDPPVQQTARQNNSRRRPSVMDYLVSHGPTKYPVSTSRASSTASRSVVSDGQIWPSHERATAHGGKNNVFSGPQAEERRQPLAWTAQQPSLRLLEQPLSNHEDHGSEVSHRRVVDQSWEHHIPSAPSSNLNISHNDNRSEIHTGSYNDFANHLDNMAPSGYHLLAAKLSGGTGGQPITPIYRRFDALNHRLLLYMQDEIADLERQLIALEAKDTAKRSYAGGVIPASRRQDRWISGNLADQKTEILGLIGYKLSQYNQVLASFCKVQDIPAPTWRDIHMYKTYLTTTKLIVDDETRFLDASNDLISLSAQNQSVDDFNAAADGLTPMPKAADDQQFHGFFKDNDSSPSTRTRLDQGSSGLPGDALLIRLTLSGTCIIIVPIMIFSIIPSFIGRMAIVLLVALSITIMVEQLGLLPEVERNKRDWAVYLGLYCGAMTVVAGAVK